MTGITFFGLHFDIMAKERSESSGMLKFQCVYSLGTGLKQQEGRALEITQEITIVFLTSMTELWIGKVNSDCLSDKDTFMRTLR